MLNLLQDVFAKGGGGTGVQGRINRATGVSARNRRSRTRLLASIAGRAGAAARRRNRGA